MKKRLLLTLVTIIFFPVVWIGYKYLPAQSLPSNTHDTAGLNWQECEISQADYEGKSYNLRNACIKQMQYEVGSDNSAEKNKFGSKAPTIRDTKYVDGKVEKDRLKKVYERLANQDGLQLDIGNKVYETITGSQEWKSYTLYENGKPVTTLEGNYTSFSPNVSLQNVNNKVAWEFASYPNNFTVIYDGKDLRNEYGLEKVYRPYSLANKLIFVGKKDNKYFIHYDGRKIGTDFDEIFVAYCCEPAANSVQYANGQYLFQGIREGKYYLVKISEAD